MYDARSSFGIELLTCVKPTFLSARVNRKDLTSARAGPDHDDEHHAHILEESHVFQDTRTARTA
jgi:hypothetical protein